MGTWVRRLVPAFAYAITWLLAPGAALAQSEMVMRDVVGWFSDQGGVITFQQCPGKNTTVIARTEQWDELLRTAERKAHRYASRQSKINTIYARVTVSYRRAKLNDSCLKEQRVAFCGQIRGEFQVLRKVDIYTCTTL